MDARALDNYITGSHYSQDLITHVCVNGHVWLAAMATEYGGSFYINDDDSVCAKCEEPGMTEYELKFMQMALGRNEKYVKIYRELMSKFSTKELEQELKSVRGYIKDKTQRMINNLPLEQVEIELTNEITNRKESEHGLDN